MNTMLQIQKNSDTSILNNNNVIFDEIINLEGDINYNSENGTITLNKEGLYIIDWYVSTQSSGTTPQIVFKIVSNNNDEFYSNTVNKASSMSGIANINVTVAPIQLSLVNTSNATIFFPSEMPSKANLRVVYIGNDTVTEDYSCFGLKQFANVLDQVVNIYQGATVNIYSSYLGTITAIIDSIYKSPNAGNVPLLIIDQGGSKSAINIDEIAALYLVNTYDDSITYLQPPDPFPINCNTDILKDIHDYVSVGDDISINASPITTASGNVHINEYGVIVLADETSTIFLVASKMLAVSIDTPATDLSKKGIKAVTIKSNK